MPIIRSNCVHFNISALGDDKLFVYKTAISTYFIDIWIEARAAVVNFSKQTLATPTSTYRIVDIDVVIFSIYRLFD
jgi:hypothetical protein